MGHDFDFTGFSDRARKVMALAGQEAQRFNHEYIGTEHILLALFKEGLGLGASVLKNSFGLELSAVRFEVEKLVKVGPEMVTMGRLPQTPRAKKVLEYAVEEADNLGHRRPVGTEHLLLGLLREADGVAAKVLNEMGVTLESAREAILEMLGVDNPRERKDRPMGDRDATSGKQVPVQHLLKAGAYRILTSVRDDNIFWLTLKKSDGAVVVQPIPSSLYPEGPGEANMLDIKEDQGFRIAIFSVDPTAKS